MTVATETRAFEAEVSQVLHLVTHSLYSHKEIFLRELISNASDACDKLRFAALSDASLTSGDADLHIDISFDKDARTLTIRDSGIGMTREEVIENIGTIARSGTRRFLESLSGDARKDTQLIGQFGVGFYSSFIVADRVTLVTRRAGLPAAEGVRWESDGSGEYSIETLERRARGTEVTLHLREGEDELLEPWRIQSIVMSSLIFCCRNASCSPIRRSFASPARCHSSMYRARSSINDFISAALTHIAGSSSEKLHVKGAIVASHDVVVLVAGIAVHVAQWIVFVGGLQVALFVARAEVAELFQFPLHVGRERF